EHAPHPPNPPPPGAVGRQQAPPAPARRPPATTTRRATGHRHQRLVGRHGRLDLPARPRGPGPDPLRELTGRSLQERDGWPHRFLTGRPHLYGSRMPRRSRRGGGADPHASPGRESPRRKPPTTARITTAATNSSAAISGPLLATGGAGSPHFAGGCGLAEQVFAARLRHHGAVAQERHGHGVLLRCPH